MYVNISKNVTISINVCQYVKNISIFQQIYVNIAKRCQYFNKFMSIFQKMSIFQQMYVNIKKNQQNYVDIKKKQYFDKFMSIFQKNINISLNVCPKRSRSGAKRSGCSCTFNRARDPPQARASQDPGYI